jgi:hypothetical protein
MIAMSGLAVVDLLNVVPPGGVVPDGGVGFAAPAPLMWVIAMGLAAVVLVTGEGMAGATVAWWRRLRRSAQRVAMESLGIPSI